MVDGRKNNGGNKNAGRKSKAEELGLAEMMELKKPLKEVLDIFVKLMNSDDEKIRAAVTEKWLNWRVGKPKETKEVKKTTEHNFPDWME
jgi:hypothetical protein